jgi:TonB-linked SusC/RagA family outer membrane protein
VFDVQQSSVTQSAIFDNSYTYDAWIDYKKSIDEAHNFTLTAGTTIWKTWGEGLFATGFGVPNNSWENADINLTTSFIEDNPNASYVYDERRLSYFGRLQYDYKGKYLLSALLRRDSSTRFGPTKRVAYFPSFSAGWVVSEEDFFGDSNLVDFLKFRVSYGTLGNDEFGNNLYLSLLTGEATYVFNNTLVNGTATGVVTNPDLQWEEAKKFDAGLDLRLFDGKVEITADYFNDIRDNLLIVNLPVSGIVGVGAPGAGAPTVNAGEVKNYGAEFAINYNNKIGDDFSINVNYNVTLIKNKVTRVNNGTGIVEGGSFGVSQPAMARMEVGQPLGYFYGYVTDGIFQNQAEIDAHPSQIALGATSAPGDIRYVDINEDGVINANDRTNVGDPIPSATMGFNVTLNYKNFDFATFLFSNIGNDMVRNYERVLSDVNRMSYTLDRWTGEGTSSTVPRVTTAATGNNVFSDYFVEDASFVRINRVELGYSIDEKAIAKAGMSSARVYLGVNNLYTFTKYRGYDPAASTGAPIGGGIDFGFYPVPRTYLLGASINF